jgi:type IV secretion system protein VirB5
MRVFVIIALMHGSASSAILPTVDLGAIGQLVKQVEAMHKQYSMLKRIHMTQVGHYRRGVLGLDSALRSSYVVPGSWQDIVGKQRRGQYGAKKEQYSRMLNSYSEKQFRDSDGVAAKSYGLTTDAVLSAMASGDAIFSEVNAHLKNMRKFAQRVDKTVNSKDAQDLRNRIAVENGMLQTAMAKINVLSLYLQANVLHQQNNAIAVNHRYFKLLK